MACRWERTRTSEGLFLFTRWGVAFPHNLWGHRSEWWQGGGEFHGQPCLGGGRRAAEVAHAVAAGRGLQSPLWWQRHLRALAACTACPRRWCEHSASGAVIHSAFAFKRQRCHLQPGPPPEQKNGVKAPKGKFALLLIGVKGEKSERKSHQSLVHV